MAKRWNKTKRILIVCNTNWEFHEMSDRFNNNICMDTNLFIAKTKRCYIYVINAPDYKAKAFEKYGFLGIENLIYKGINFFSAKRLFTYITTYDEIKAHFERKEMIKLLTIYENDFSNKYNYLFD